MTMNYDAITGAWRASVERLAEWVEARLVNRHDVFGRYLPIEKRKRGTAFTEKRGVTRADLIKHFRGDRPSDVMGLHTTSPSNTSHWGCFDIDEKKGDESRAKLNFQRAEALVATGERRGIHGLFEDSNGAGGYHIWLIFTEPVSTARLVAKMVSLREECGIPAREIEIFPKQSVLRDSGDVGNWVRVPGRHHDGRQHWSRFLHNGVWLEGADAAQHLLQAPLNDPSLLTEDASASHALLPDAVEPMAVKKGKFGEGQRHNMLRDEARRLYRPSAYTPRELQAMLQALNVERCNPPLPEREVEALVAWIANHGVDDEIEELNQRFAVIQRAGQVLILDTGSSAAAESGGYCLLRTDHFHTLLANRRLFIEKKWHDLSRLWLTHKYRREYSGFAFDPTDNAPRDRYNIWQGFAVERNPNGSCSLFIEHLRVNVCGGNEEYFRWVLGWFAALFQNPLNKLGTALVLRGKQGTGKTIVGQVIGHLLGRHYAIVATQRLITGNFNAHQQHILLLQADEAFYAGDKKIAGALKDLITNEKLFVEPKFVDPLPMPNRIRLLVTSNEEWTIPAGDDERRFTVLDVGEGRRQDSEFFGRMLDELRNEGGYGALLDLLLTYEYDEKILRRPLETDALKEEQERGLDIEASWWLDILQSGLLPGDRNGHGHSDNRELYDDYIETCKNVGHAHRLNLSAFGTRLSKFAPFKKSEHRVHESFEGPGTRSRIQARQFPTLLECRRLFEARIGRRIAWSDDQDVWSPWIPRREEEF